MVPWCPPRIFPSLRGSLQRTLENVGSHSSRNLPVRRHGCLRHARDSRTSAAGVEQQLRKEVVSSPRARAEAAAREAAIAEMEGQQ